MVINAKRVLSRAVKQLGQRVMTLAKKRSFPYNSSPFVITNLMGEGLKESFQKLYFLFLEILTSKQMEWYNPPYSIFSLGFLKEKEIECLTKRFYQKKPIKLMITNGLLTWLSNLLASMQHSN